MLIGPGNFIFIGQFSAFDFIIATRKTPMRSVRKFFAAKGKFHTFCPAQSGVKIIPEEAPSSFDVIYSSASEKPYKKSPLQGAFDRKILKISTTCAVRYGAGSLWDGHFCKPETAGVPAVMTLQASYFAGHPRTERTFFLSPATRQLTACCVMCNARPVSAWVQPEASARASRCSSGLRHSSSSRKA